MDTRPITSYTVQPATTGPGAPQHMAGGHGPGTAPVHEPDGKHISAPNTRLQWEAKFRRYGRLHIGVEFDGHRLVLVGARCTRKRDTIERLHIVEWADSPSADDLAICLRKFVPRGHPGVAVVISTSRAMVRYFHLPPVAGRHREAGARWEGQKLLPFALTEKTALVGLDFEQDGTNGWWTTLVAIPREDGTPILEAMDRLGWPLSSVSLRGTHSVPETTLPSTNDKKETKAVVLYAQGRGSFTVFRDGRLRFHYDLGKIPEPPSGEQTGDSEWAATAYRAWVEILGSLITDPFEFCLGVGPEAAPQRLELIGLPEEILPLITDWNSRFPAGVTVNDPLRAAKDRLPREIAQWVDNHSGLIVPAFLAASGHKAVDCTPSRARKKRHVDDYSRIARGALLISVAIAAAWIAFNWVNLDYRRRTLAGAWQEHKMYQESPAVADVRARAVELTSARRRLAQIQRPSLRWMPWAKTVLGTLPDNAGLSIVEMQRQESPAGTGAESIVSVRLIGTLSPEGPPHPLTYRRWIGQLGKLTTPEDQPRLQERSTMWKGRARSTFSIEMRPAVSIVTGGGQ
ncbi:MAG TPA: hypothetical protein VM118_04805 [Acidobacteriota bacterium]|nr:hypothetical protein [Acidobacteriota bacterium]